MKQAAIITSAGLSSRFSASLGHEASKVLFTEKPDQKCLLELQLELLQTAGIEDVILVGGYKYDELAAFVAKRFPQRQIKLVFNEHFHDLGSGHSLALGIEALENDYDRVLFLEGDLYCDRPAFGAAAASPKNVITLCPGPITADKSVAFYLPATGGIRYIYDTLHKLLEINEPFKMVANSGQIWKFCDLKMLKEVTAQLSPAERAGTNLVIISAYFNSINLDDVSYIEFKDWFNCNTIDDYRAIADYYAM